MTSHPPAQCCTVGVKYEGTLSGRFVNVANWNAYVAVPSPERAHNDVAILYLPDIIRIWNNSQLVADQFAVNGYYTLLIDLFNGDPVDINAGLSLDEIMKWIAQGSDGKNPHTKEYVDPIVEAGIQYLKQEKGFKKIGAVGYCFGAKYVVRHYKTGVDVGYFAHPSDVTEDELASITGPLSFAAAEIDPIFPDEERHKSEQILRKTGQPLADQHFFWCHTWICCSL